MYIYIYYYVYIYIYTYIVWVSVHLQGDYTNLPQPKVAKPPGFPTVPENEPRCLWKEPHQRLPSNPQKIESNFCGLIIDLVLVSIPIDLQKTEKRIWFRPLGTPMLDIEEPPY